MYKNNKKNGFCLLKNGQGDRTEFSNYKDGKRHGKCKFFHDIIIIVCNYTEGNLNGKLQSFINKKLFEEMYYVDNLQSGYYKRYYYNQMLREEGNYKDDLKHGKWTYYDLNGDIIDELFFENGLFVFL